MSKYLRLTAHLKSLGSTPWKASFAEIEAILGFPLPASARRYPAWWANQTDHGHSQTRGWRDANWRTSDLDLGGETVTFSAAPPSAQEMPNPVEAKPTMATSVGAMAKGQRLSISEAKTALSAYYDIPVENIVITLTG